MGNSKIDQLIAQEVQNVNERREQQVKERVHKIISNIAHAQNEIKSYERGIKQQREEIKQWKEKLTELEEAEVFTL